MSGRGYSCSGRNISPCAKVLSVPGFLVSFRRFPGRRGFLRSGRDRWEGGPGCPPTWAGCPEALITDRKVRGQGPRTAPASHAGRLPGDEGLRAPSSRVVGCAHSSQGAGWLARTRLPEGYNPGICLPTLPGIYTTLVYASLPTTLRYTLPSTLPSYTQTHCTAVCLVGSVEAPGLSPEIN